MTKAGTVELDLDHLRKWIGKTDETSDVITPRLAQTLRATLFLKPGEPKAGDAAPLSVHWCLSPAVVAAPEIGPDGHPARGGFLPPVPLPRRMWAGAQTDYLDAPRVGDTVRRRATIANVELKSGSTGPLCFVTVDHVFSTPRGDAIKERQNIVYRDAAPPEGNTTSASAKGAPPKAKHSRSLNADPVLLFRYSAITFNGHRIHYDRPYVTGVEGYPGLIVHGPLQASLLLEYATELKGKSPRHYTHRGVSPLFDGAAFTVNANETDKGLDLWTADSTGTPTMKATAAW